jgi:DNA repair exonuclease SbcCD ATPase subunit
MSDTDSAVTAVSGTTVDSDVRQLGLTVHDFESAFAKLQQAQVLLEDKDEELRALRHERSDRPDRPDQGGRSASQLQTLNQRVRQLQTQNGELSTMLRDAKQALGARDTGKAQCKQQAYMKTLELQEGLMEVKQAQAKLLAKIRKRNGEKQALERQLHQAQTSLQERETAQQSLEHKVTVMQGKLAEEKRAASRRGTARIFSSSFSDASSGSNAGDDDTSMGSTIMSNLMGFHEAEIDAADDSAGNGLPTTTRDMQHRRARQQLLQATRQLHDLRQQLRQGRAF